MEIELEGDSVLRSNGDSLGSGIRASSLFSYIFSYT